MDSPLLRTIVQSACLAARSVHQTLSFLHDDDDFWQPDGRKRPRPGVVGRPDYRKSPWGKMLNEEADQLRIPGSSTANLFRRRFRSPFLLFEMLMVDVQEWHKNFATHDVTGREAIQLELKVLGVQFYRY